MFSKKATKLTKSSPSICHYAVSVKSTVKISSIFVAFLESTNFTTIFQSLSIDFQKMLQMVAQPIQ